MPDLTRLIAGLDPADRDAMARLFSAVYDALAGISAHRRTGPRKLARLLAGDLDWVVMKCRPAPRRNESDGPP